MSFSGFKELILMFLGDMGSDVKKLVGPRGSLCFLIEAGLREASTTGDKRCDLAELVIESFDCSIISRSCCLFS